MAFKIEEAVKHIHTFGSQPTTMSKEAFAKELKKMREKDSRLVTVRFKNYENPGGTLSFPYKKYPGEAAVTYSFTDGEIYRIPEGVAKYICNDVSYPIYTDLKDMPGVKQGTHDGTLKTETWRVKSRKYRFSFESLEFMRDDLELNRSNLVEVSVG